MAVFLLKGGTVVDKSEGIVIGSQVVLIVVYEAGGARFMLRIRGEELLQFRINGQAIEPPAATLGEVYRWPNAMAS